MKIHDQKYWITKLRNYCRANDIPFCRFEPGPYSQSGIPDCMIRPEYENIFIEVKASGKLSPSQLKFLDKFGGLVWYPNRKIKTKYELYGEWDTIPTIKILEEVMR
jgi:hypothetical protein